MNLAFIDTLPTRCTRIDELLRGHGFSCHTENTTDSFRWRRYLRPLATGEDGTTLRLVLAFELTISDDPGGSYDDNHDLQFEEAYVEILSAPPLRRLARFTLHPRTLPDLTHLFSLFR